MVGLELLGTGCAGVCLCVYVHRWFGVVCRVLSHVAMWMWVRKTGSWATTQPPPHPLVASVSEPPASCCSRRRCCCCYCLLLQFWPHHYVAVAAAVAACGLGQALASSSSGTGSRKHCKATAKQNWKSEKVELTITCVLYKTENSALRLFVLKVFSLSLCAQFGHRQRNVGKVEDRNEK